MSIHSTFGYFMTPLLYHYVWYVLNTPMCCAPYTGSPSAAGPPGRTGTQHAGSQLQQTHGKAVDVVITHLGCGILLKGKCVTTGSEQPPLEINRH